MEIKFEYRGIVTEKNVKKSYGELMKHALAFKHPMLGLCVILGAFALGVLAGIKSIDITKFFPALCMVVGALLVVGVVLGIVSAVLADKRIKKLNLPQEETFRFYEDHLEYAFPGQEGRGKKYAKLRAVVHKNDFYLLVFSMGITKIGCLLWQGKFTVGEEKDFLPFVKSKIRYKSKK